jgi:hypothetical protein
MIDLLVEYGAMLDRADPQGKTAIWYATEPNILRHLLENGADPDGGKVNDRSLIETLCFECGRGSDKRTKEKIDLLRAEGAEYTVRCMISLGDLMEFEKAQTERFDQKSRDDLFIHAVESKRAIMAYLLLKTGANPNRQPKVLLEALKRRELTTLLLDHGADVASEFNISELGHSGPKISDRFQAIHIASSSPEYFEGLTVLLEREVDPNARDSDGETPLFWAIRAASRNRSHDLLPTILVLLRSGALNSIENNQGETPDTLAQYLKISDSIQSILTSKRFRSPQEQEDRHHDDGPRKR